MSVGPFLDLDNKQSFTLPDTDEEEEPIPRSVNSPDTIVNNKENTAIKIAQNVGDPEIPTWIPEATPAERTLGKETPAEGTEARDEESKSTQGPRTEAAGTRAKGAQEDPQGRGTHKKSPQESGTQGKGAPAKGSQETKTQGEGTGTKGTEETKTQGTETQGSGAEARGTQTMGAERNGTQAKGTPKTASEADKSTVLASFRVVGNFPLDSNSNDNPVPKVNDFLLKNETFKFEASKIYEPTNSPFKQKWEQEKTTKNQQNSVTTQLPSDHCSIITKQNLKDPKTDLKQGEVTTQTKDDNPGGSNHPTATVQRPEPETLKINSENPNLPSSFDSGSFRKKFRATINPDRNQDQKISVSNEIVNQNPPVDNQNPTDYQKPDEPIADDKQIIQEYFNFLRKEISRLSAKDFCDFLQTGSTNLHQTTLSRTLSSLKLPSNLDSAIVKELKKYGTTTWELLHKVVTLFEEEFEKTAFFDDDEFLQVSQNIQQTCSATFRQIHHDLKATVEKSIKSFITEYENVNQEIRLEEEEISAELLEHAIKYYEEEIKFCVTEKSFWDEKDLEKFHQTIKCDAISNFLKAAEIENKGLKNKMQGCLEVAINGIYTRERENNRRKAKVQADKIATDSSDQALILYKEHLSAIPYDPSNPKIFLRSEKQARERAEEAFKKDTESLLPHIVNPIFISLQTSLNSSCNVRQKENAAQDQKNRKEEETERRERTNSILKVDTAGQSNRPADNTPKIAREKTTENSQSEKLGRWSPKGLKSLPNDTLCIHLGLHESIVATTDNGTAQIIRHCRNEVHFRNNGDSHPLGGLLIKNPLNEPYKIKVNHSPSTLKSSNDCFRIEQLLAIMMERWRNAAELLLHRRFDVVIIVIPQTLNRHQRLSVEHSAQLAGFQRIDLINDTHALALAHTIENNMGEGKIVTATNFDGHVNAASFNVTNGVIKIDTVSGEFYLPADTSRLEKILAYIPLVNRFVTPSSRKVYGSIFKDLKIKDSEKPKKLVSFGNHVDTALNDAFGNFDHRQDREYAVKGAVFLSAIEKEEGAAYHKWLQVTQNAIIFAQWKDQFLQLHQDADERLKTTNNKGGVNIEHVELTKLKDNPIPLVKEERNLHQVKMEILQLIYNVEMKLLFVNDPRQKAHIQTQVDSYKAEVQNNPDLTLMDLEKYKDDVLLILKNASA